MASEDTPPTGAIETETQHAERELEKAREVAEQARISAAETHAEYETKASEAKAAADKVADLKARIKDAEVTAADLRKQADELERAEAEAKRLADEAEHRRIAAEEKAKRLEEALAAVKVAEEADAKAKNARKEADEAAKRAQDAEAAALAAKAEADAKLKAVPADSASKSALLASVKRAATPIPPTTAAVPPTPPTSPKPPSATSSPNWGEHLNGKLDDVIKRLSTIRWIDIVTLILILLLLFSTAFEALAVHYKLDKLPGAVADAVVTKLRSVGDSIFPTVTATISEGALRKVADKTICSVASASAPKRECVRQDFRCSDYEKFCRDDGWNYRATATCEKRGDCGGGWDPLTAEHAGYKRECPANLRKKKQEKPAVKKTEETKKEEKKEEVTSVATSDETPPEPKPADPVVCTVNCGPVKEEKETKKQEKEKPAPAPHPPAEAATPKGAAEESITSSSGLRRIALADVKTVADGQLKLIKRPGPDGCQLALRVAGDVGHELYRKGSATAVVSGNGVFVTVVATDHPYLLTLRSSKGYLFRMSTEEAKMDQVSSPDGTVISNFYFKVNPSCNATEASDF